MRTRKCASPRYRPIVAATPSAAGGWKRVFSASISESGSERQVVAHVWGFVNPVRQPEDDLLKFGAPLGELVDVRAGRRRQFPSTYDACSRHLAESLSQDVGAGPGHAGHQLGEALRAEEQFAHDQQCPSLTDQVERVRDRAALVVPAFSHHRRQPTSRNRVLQVDYLVFPTKKMYCPSVGFSTTNQEMKKCPYSPSTHHSGRVCRQGRR